MESSSVTSTTTAIQDIFLCNYGQCPLSQQWRWDVQGHQQPAGIDRAGWSFGGAFLDYDNDGDLDLYVANYGYWKLPDDDRYCGAAFPDEGLAEAAGLLLTHVDPPRPGMCSIGITAIGPSPM